MIGAESRNGERGVALITALLSTLILLGLGLALLSIVDVQASESVNERTRDRSFNLSEGVLTGQAFVLGRNWPEQAVGGLPNCSTLAAGLADTVGATSATTPSIQRVRANIARSFADDPAYAGATWKVNICDNVPASTVWTDALLTNPNYDANGDDLVWVRAEATVQDKRRAVVGLVQVTKQPVMNSRYALAGGGLTDDLGSSINALATNGLLGAVVGDLLGATPTVAPDPSVPPGTPSGITGVRCGALDSLGAGGLSPCLSGTLGATDALPVASSLLTGGRVETLPGATVVSEENIGRLRAQAQAQGTYYASRPGTAPVASTNPLAPTDTAPQPPPPMASCLPAGSVPGAGSVVFIEQVGDTGPNNVAGGQGDQYCALDVSVAKTFKAIIVASGRVVIRGNNVTTAASNQSANTFTGVVYGLNRQRLPIADGGRGLGDGANPGREIVRIDRGAHVRGGVNADGKSGRVGVYPPAPQINQTRLSNFVCARQPVKCLLTGLFGTLSSVLSIFGPADTIAGLLDQLSPARADYGSAITADVNAISALTVYGASGVIPGTFRDLAGR